MVSVSYSDVFLRVQILESVKFHSRTAPQPQLQLPASNELEMLTLVWGYVRVLQTTEPGWLSEHV